MILDDIIITRVFDVMTIPIELGTVRQIKDRFAYGLSFCSTSEGCLKYSHNGRDFISDSSNVILLPMGQTYMLRGMRAGQFPLINFYCDRSFAVDEFELFEIDSLNYYIKTYEYIRNMCVYNQPFCNARAMGAFYEMLSHLMMNPFSGRKEILQPAVEYMEKNYADPELSIEDIALHAHLSSGYFRRVFKTQYSISPKTYILNARIGKAKELLVGASYLSISDVAVKCGFTNVYHFDRVFKEFTGCTPSEYNRRYSQML